MINYKFTSLITFVMKLLLLKLVSCDYNLNYQQQQRQQQQQQQIIINGNHYFNYNQNFYIDNSTACTKIYYSIKRVVQNCSSLNIAADFSVIPVKQSGYVTELLLANNSFRLSLPFKEINQYDSIDLLDLSYNLLTEFTTDLQLIDCSANYLKDLVLNSNLFARIPLLNLNCMNQLEKLSLNNNKNLVYLDDMNTFTNPVNYANTTKIMSNLKHLDLSYCSIQTINQLNFTILQYFPSLTYLNLIGNNIKVIYANPFVYAFNLMYLSFENNSLQCSSSILWMKQFFSTNKQIMQINLNGSYSSSIYSPTCFSNLTLSNQTIISLDDSLFQSAIYLNTTVSSNILNVVCGNTVELQCSEYSNPTSDLWWTFNERVLSRIVAPEQPYQFIENFNSTSSPLYKTSILRIKNVDPKLAGNYSCKAYYLNFEPANGMIASISFVVNVLPNPNQGVSLDSGSIAGIVIGSIVAFLLLCLIVFLVIYCCCYRRCCCEGCCCCCYCCFNRPVSSKKKSNYNDYTASNVKTRKVVSEMEENASGFKDLNKIKPNYVSNTISKSTFTHNNNQLDSSSLTWQPTSPTNHEAHFNTSGTNNKDAKDLYTNEVLLDLSPASANHQQQNHQPDLLDGLNYDETTVYNLNNTQNKRQQFQVYTIKHPIDYGSTYNTNEGYIINDPNEIEQIINHNPFLDQQTRHHDDFKTTITTPPPAITHQYSHKYSSDDEYNRKVASLTHELMNTESFKQKQYIYGAVNDNHDFNNPSFIKYDSDV